MQVKNIFRHVSSSILICLFSFKIISGAPVIHSDYTIYMPGDNAGNDSSLIFINMFIENGSVLNWERAGGDTILFNLAYDYERAAFNRAYTHWHFLINARAGSDLTLILQNFNEIYNGKPVPFSYSWPADCVVSKDGRKWQHVPAEWIEGERMRVMVHMDSDSLYVASVEPYRISDLQRMFSRIKDDPRIGIIPIGESVEGRELDIIQIGKENTPRRIFMRARAHPWEAGSNWVIEGIVNNLLQHTTEVSEFLKHYTIYILPMADIDGVAHGKTRFNMNGMDLNRNLTRPADSVLSPENAAMELWIAEMIAKGLKPDLAIDFHNDSNGNLNFSSSGENSAVYVSHMKLLEKLLRAESWFSEGSSFNGTTTFEEGLMSRYGIEGLVYELNAHWIKGLNKEPLSDDWKLLGKQLCEVFNDYFKKIER